jgi:hypothetical protein
MGWSAIEEEEEEDPLKHITNFYKPMLTLGDG